jgi:hypothetical protein
VKAIPKFRFHWHSNCVFDLSGATPRYTRTRMPIMASIAGNEKRIISRLLRSRMGARLRSS